MNPIEFVQAVKKVHNLIKNDLPAVVGIEGIRHIKESFHNEGFTDETLEKWDDISARRKDQKRRKDGSLPPILTEFGDLGDSPTWKADSEKVTFSTDVVYAQRHNEGTHGMPKRQFMGPSKALEKKIVNKFEKELDKIFNS